RSIEGQCFNVVTLTDVGTPVTDLPAPDVKNRRAVGYRHEDIHVSLRGPHHLSTPNFIGRDTTSGGWSGITSDGCGACITVVGALKRSEVSSLVDAEVIVTYTGKTDQQVEPTVTVGDNWITAVDDPFIPF